MRSVRHGASHSVLMRVFVAVGSNASVGGGDDSGGRIVDVRHLVEGNPALPFMSIVAAT